MDMTAKEREQRTDVLGSGDGLVSKFLVGALADLHLRKGAGRCAGDVNRASGHLQGCARQSLVNIDPNFVIVGDIFRKKLGYQCRQTGS